MRERYVIAFIKCKFYPSKKQLRDVFSPDEGTAFAVLGWTDVIAFLRTKDFASSLSVVAALAENPIMQELRPVEVRIAYAMVIEGSLLKISSVDPAVLVFGDFFEKGVEDTTVEEISCDEFRCYCKMHTMGWEDMILFINPQISLTRMFSKLETLFGEKRIETCSIVLGRMGEDDTLVNARVLVKIGNLSDWKTYWTSLKKRSDIDVEDHGIYGGHDRELVFKQVSLKILMEVLRDTRKHALDTHTYIVGDTPPP